MDSNTDLGDSSGGGNKSKETGLTKISEVTETSGSGANSVRVAGTLPFIEIEQSNSCVSKIVLIGSFVFKSVFFIGLRKWKR